MSAKQARSAKAQHYSELWTSQQFSGTFRSGDPILIGREFGRVVRVWGHKMVVRFKWPDRIPTRGNTRFA